MGVTLEVTVAMDPPPKEREEEGGANLGWSGIAMGPYMHENIIIRVLSLAK